MILFKEQVHCMFWYYGIQHCQAAEPILEAFLLFSQNVHYVVVILCHNKLWSFINVRSLQVVSIDSFKVYDFLTL